MHIDDKVSTEILTKRWTCLTCCQNRDKTPDIHSQRESLPTLSPLKASGTYMMASKDEDFTISGVQSFLRDESQEVLTEKAGIRLAISESILMKPVPPEKCTCDERQHSYLQHIEMLEGEYSSKVTSQFGRSIW